MHLNHSLGCLLAVAISLLILLLVTLIFDRPHLPRMVCLLAVFLGMSIQSKRTY